jgi:C4-type zinc-finger of DNA polymerase delta
MQELCLLPRRKLKRKTIFTGKTSETKKGQVSRHIIGAVIVSYAVQAQTKVSKSHGVFLDRSISWFLVVCRRCKRNPQESLHALQGRLHEAERRLTATHATCVSCTRSSPAEDIKCESLDCPWLYARKTAEEDIESLQGVPELTEAIENLAIEDASKEVLGSGSGSDDTDTPFSDFDVFL